MMLSVAAQAQTPVADPDGLWSYSCPDAPYEYQTGKLEFAKDKDSGKLTMKFVMGESSASKAYTVEKQGSSYVCNCAVDNYDIVITFKRQGDSLSGQVLADQWELPITMKPLPK
jgi:hypothetical protein